MTRTRTAVVAGLVATALLLPIGSGLAADAAGKIKSKQIATNAILAKHIKSGAVGTDELAGGAVTGAKVAPNSLTGAQIDEATLARVPDAAAIAGSTVTPIAMKLPNTVSAPVPIATGPGWTLGLNCSASKAEVQLSKTGTSSLVTTETLAHGQAPSFSVVPTNIGLVISTTAFHFRLVSWSAGTAAKVVDLTATFAAGQFTSQTDCFFLGSVTTTP